MSSAMPDEGVSNAGAWETMGYHGTTWASMQQRRQPHARSLTVGNCSLTVAALKESLTLQQVPGPTASGPFELDRAGNPRSGVAV